MHIKDRTFIISGGASGLALACARDIHDLGGYVSLLDLNSDAGERVLEQLGPRRAKFFNCDVSETESITKAVEGTMEWVKQTRKPLGGVIAGAGVGNPGLICSGAVQIIDRYNNPLPLSAIDFVLAINLRGTLDLIRQSVPHLTQNEPLGPDGERGVLILISSSAAFEGQMGQVAYAASKGAIASLTLPLARDLSRHGIRACTIAPSMFESNMTAMMNEKTRKSLEKAMEFPRRAGKANEFARLVRDCIENVMLNGTVLRLDGAMRMPSRL